MTIGIVCISQKLHFHIYKPKQRKHSLLTASKTKNRNFAKDFLELYDIVPSKQCNGFFKTFAILNAKREESKVSLRASNASAAINRVGYSRMVNYNANARSNKKYWRYDFSRTH